MAQDLSGCEVTIAGLGLMGGSLALALQGKVRRIRGVEPAPQAARRALELGMVEAVVPLEQAVTSDLIVLAAPVQAIIGSLAELQRLAPAGAPVVLDLGSTKAQICQAMQALPPAYDPIGGHPMCGKEVSGADHAEASLFASKTFVLAPLERTGPRAWELAQRLVEALGAHAISLSPELHDRLVAGSSHLPYLSAVGLVLAGERLQDERFWQVTASGFRDSTRLAGSDLTMMVDILLSNQPAVLDSLERFQGALDDLAGLLRRDDRAGLQAALAEARQRRQKLLL